MYLKRTKELHAFNTRFADTDFAAFGAQAVDVSSVARMGRGYTRAIANTWARYFVICGCMWVLSLLHFLMV